MMQGRGRRVHADHIDRIEEASGMTEPVREEDGWQGTVTRNMAYSLRKQTPCKSEKWLVLLSAVAENKWEGDIVCEGGRIMQRSVGLNKKAFNEKQCQAG